MEIAEAASDTSVPPSRDGSPSFKTRNRLSQATVGSSTQLPAGEATGDAPAAAPDPVADEAPAPPVDGEAPAPPVDGEAPAPPVDGEAPAPPVEGETAAPPAADEALAPPAISDETPAPPAAADEATAPPQEPPVDPAQGSINPELFQAALTVTGDGAAPSEASAEVPYGSPRAIGRSGSGSSRIPPSPPANFSQRPSRTPLPTSPSLTSPSPTYDGSPRVQGSLPSVGSIIGGPSGSAFTGPPPGPIQVEATSPRRSNTAPAAATPPAARSKPPSAPALVVEQLPAPLQRRASSNSIPIRPIVEPAIPMMARGNHRPVVMPFVERHGTVGMAGGGPGGVENRGSFKAPPPASHAAGRRAGPHGAIRLGPAHSTPMPQASGVSSMTAASSGPRDMHGRVRRPDQDTLIHHSSSMTASVMPIYRHSPGSTNDGADDTLPAPPLLPAASREWERGRGGYAAGGGAAAVKAATAAAAASAPHSVNPAEQQLHQQLMLGEAVHIRSIRKANVAPASERTITSSNMTAGVAGVGVPGRRGRRVAAHPGGTSSATAAAMAAYFASVEASIADGTAPDQMLLPSGLARRLKAARIMASGPPPFQRRKEPPPPPSPTGIKLDGFMLLEAADEEMPEAVQAAVLSARHISAVESADLSYFVALRSLDVSDNKLPDLVCLAPLAALVRLRVAACRLSSLGRWPGQTVEPTAAAAAAATPTTTATASSSGTGGGGGASGPQSVVARAKSRLAAAAGAGSGTGTARPGSTEQGSGRSGTGSTAAATAEGDARGTTPEGLQQPWPRYTDSGVAAPSPAGTESLSEAAGSMDAIAAAAAAFMVAGADVHDMSSVLIPGPALGLALPLPPFQYLEVLDLSFNQLQPHMVLLPNCPLARLPRLTELDLSCNRFKRLPSPAEIRAAAAAGVGGAAASSATEGSRPSLAATAAATGPAFPALRRLRLADNGLMSAALASLAALAPPCLTHLDLSRNAIAEAPAPHLLALEQPAGPHGPSPLSSGFSSTPPTQASRKGSLAQPQHAPHAPQTQPHQRQPSPQSQFSAASASTMVSSGAGAVSLSGYLVRLAVLDLTYNRVASEAAVAPLLTLPSLQQLLLAGNPIVISLQRSDADATRSRVIDLGEPDAMPPKPSVAASLTARFARIAEAAPKQHANTLAAAASAAITSATAPERVTEVFDRMDATIEQWRLNTVMEEDEEDEDEDGDETAPDDRTFLTGVGITDSMRHKASGTNSTVAQDTVTEPSGGELDDEETEPVGGTPPPQSLGATSTGEERPLWESISDPTERLAVALGLDPLSLPIHTGALTTDAAGAIAALRFALAHPLVEANAGLGPHPGYIATTTAAQLKRKPRRAPAPGAPARLAPMGTAAAAGAAPTGGVGASGIQSPKTVKIQTMEALLEGMKGKLAALEASLTVQLAAAPPPPPPGKMSPFGRKQGRSRRRGRRARDSDSDDDDDGSSGSGLPDDVIDQIERESGSEDEDKQAVEEEMGPMDPREGLVLVADQIMTGDSIMDPRALNAALSRDPFGASPLSRATTVTLPPSSSPNSRSTQLPPSPTRTNSSPLRGSVNASTTSVAPGSRKGGGGGGSGGGPHVVPATPVTLPGGAASALGYAA